MPSYSEKALKINKLFMARLNRKEKIELFQMSSKWSNLSKNLNSMIDELSKIEGLSENQIFKLGLYKQFLEESRKQTEIYNRYASDVISENQFIFAKTGIDMTEAQIELVKIRFNRMNVDAVKNMIGFSSDGSSLFDLLNKSYPDTVSKITDTLIQSVALGRNPLLTARLMKSDMDGNLKRARTIARTEQLRVLRETSLETMKESGVVKGWRRIEADDACDECQELDGKEYDLDEPFETHPNCRGTTSPIVR